MEEGMDEIWRMLSKGDSICFKIPAKQLFEATFHQRVPANIKPESEFKFELGVNDVLTREQAIAFETALQDKRMEEYLRKAEEISNKEIAKIDQYLDSLHITNAIKDSSGVRIVINTLGKGPKPAAHDSVVVKYQGLLLANGAEFDKSDRPVTFNLRRLVSGWQVGLPYVPEGSKATLYLPSTLGYGPNGSPPAIPPYAILKFNIELVKVIRTKGKIQTKNSKK
jgi:FKBP-type peptidyl-prolyl cis-trans isomerase